MSYARLDRMRDVVACHLANFILRTIATPRYRAFVDGTIRYGLIAAARDDIAAKMANGANMRLRLSVTIDQSNDHPEEIIADAADLHDLVAGSTALEADGGVISTMTIGGYTFTIDPDSIVTEDL